MSIRCREIILIPVICRSEPVKRLDRLFISAGLKQCDPEKVPIPSRRKRIASQIALKNPYSLIPSAKKRHPHGVLGRDSDVQGVECDGPLEMKTGQVMLTRYRASVAECRMTPGIRLIE